MSVATWSLRERPVCRRLPASPTSAVRRFSMLRCTSSRSSDHSNLPDSISSVTTGHAALDVGQVGGGDDALAGQHAGVGQRATDVLAPHALVEIDRGGVAFDEIGNRFGEAAGPNLLIGVGSHDCGLEWGRSATNFRRNPHKDDKYGTFRPRTPCPTGAISGHAARAARGQWPGLLALVQAPDSASGWAALFGAVVEPLLLVEPRPAVAMAGWAFAAARLGQAWVVWPAFWPRFSLCALAVPGRGGGVAARRCCAGHGNGGPVAGLFRTALACLSPAQAEAGWRPECAHPAAFPVQLP